MKTKEELIEIYETDPNTIRIREIQKANPLIKPKNNKMDIFFYFRNKGYGEEFLSKTLEIEITYQQKGNVYGHTKERLIRY